MRGLVEDGSTNPLIVEGNPSNFLAIEQSFSYSSFFQRELTKDVDNSINPLCHVLSIVKGSHDIFWAHKNVRCHNCF